MSKLQAWSIIAVCILFPPFIIVATMILMFYESPKEVREAFITYNEREMASKLSLREKRLLKKQGSLINPLK